MKLFYIPTSVGCMNLVDYLVLDKDLTDDPLTSVRVTAKRNKSLVRARV